MPTDCVCQRDQTERDRAMTIKDSTSQTTPAHEESCPAFPELRCPSSWLCEDGGACSAEALLNAGWLVMPVTGHSNKDSTTTDDKLSDLDAGEDIIVWDDPGVREMQLRQYASGALSERHGIKPGMLNWPMFMLELFAEIDRLRAQLKDNHP